MAGISPILGETLSIYFEKFLIVTILTLWGLGPLQEMNGKIKSMEEYEPKSLVKVILRIPWITL